MSPIYEAAEVGWALPNRVSYYCFSSPQTIHPLLGVGRIPARKRNAAARLSSPS